MDYATLVFQLVRAMRGRRSQQWLSRRLGFKGNQLYRWESGLRTMDWRDFLRLAKICQFDVGRALNKSIGYSLPADQSANLVRFLIGESKVSTAAATLDLSPQIVRRWLRGATEPPLSQMLRMLDLFQGRLLDWIEQLCPRAELACLRERRAEMHARRELSFIFPVANLIVAALESEPYRHRRRHKRGVIAARLGISVELEVQIIEHLRQAGIIAWTGQRYEIQPRGMEIFSKDPALTLKQRHYWTQVADEFLKTATTLPQSSMFGWSVFAVSDTAYRSIQEKFRECYAQIVGIANSDLAPRQAVKMVNLQCIDLDELVAQGGRLPI
jgi:transcriptional regulator with XRE-family HTH domain